MSITELLREKLDAKAEHLRAQITRNHQPTVEEEMLGNLNKLVLMLKEEIPFDKSALGTNTLLNNYQWANALATFINLGDRSNKGYTFIFNESHPLLRSLIHPQFINTHFEYPLWNCIVSRLTYLSSAEVSTFIQFLLQQGFNEDEILRRQILLSEYPFHIAYIFTNPPVNGYGTYITPQLIEKKGFFGIGGKPSKVNIIHKTLFEKKHRNTNSELGVLSFLYGVNPDLIENQIPYYLIILDHYNKPVLSITAARFLLQNNASRYKNVILDVINKIDVKPNEIFEIYSLLHQHTNEDHAEILTEIGEEHLSSLQKIGSGKFYGDPSVNKKNMSIAYASFLLSRDQEKGKARILDYVQNYDIVFPHFLTYIDEVFKEESVPILIEAIGKDSKVGYGWNFYKRLFDILDKYDYKPFVDRVFHYLTTKASKEDRETICLSLSKQGGIVIEKAKTLLNGKTVNERIAAALILSHIESPDIKTLLKESVDSETNDDTRNIILEAIKDDQSAPMELENILSMIQAADRRKKLNKWNEKNLEEESLPSLYWEKTGSALTVTEKRFLFYRMKQAKGINSDPEAREAIKHIDKTRSEKFASQLLQAFVDSNADPKLKYYMTMAGMLGGDVILNKLHTLFRKSLADKRVKMAEYILGAIAMVGSNKALRIIEVISRKFANKKPQLSKAALDSLQAAAEELQITQDQLSDRIIPDFGFEGLYREFNAGDETYRAVISSDFKLCYYDENRKLRKSIPANTDKEIVKDFKEIEKEIREIVRSQDGRLEKYMVEGRRWKVNEWKEIFFNNPIMFVYATKLIWVLYNENDELINVFYCDEDMESLDVNSEAIDLEEGDGIRILHPTDLSTEQLQQWKDKLYDSNLKTVFPLLERSVFEKDEAEFNSNITKVFYNEAVPKGADFVITHLVKCGWRKETGDGGSITLTKHLQQPSIQAFANIEGPQVIYQGGTAKATVYEISFTGKNWNDSVKIKDVPKRFYSETIADIDAMIKAQ